MGFLTSLNASSVSVSIFFGYTQDTWLRLKKPGHYQQLPSKTHWQKENETTSANPRGVESFSKPMKTSVKGLLRYFVSSHNPFAPHEPRSSSFSDVPHLYSLEDLLKRPGRRVLELPKKTLKQIKKEYPKNLLIYFIFFEQHMTSSKWSRKTSPEKQTKGVTRNTKRSCLKSHTEFTLVVFCFSDGSG